MAENKAEQQTPEQKFEFQRVYVKDSSFEAPNAPKIFLKEWKPEVSVDLNVDNAKVDDNVYEVILTITVTTKAGDETAFLAEVKQAGVFLLEGFNEEQMKPMLGAFCPNILFPFARETVADMVNRGSFPQLLLAPINFDALYQQQLEQSDEGTTKEAAEETKH